MFLCVCFFFLALHHLQGNHEGKTEVLLYTSECKFQLRVFVFCVCFCCCFLALCHLQGNHEGKTEVLLYTSGCKFMLFVSFLVLCCLQGNCELKMAEVLLYTSGYKFLLICLFVFSSSLLLARRWKSCSTSLGVSFC